MLITFFLFSLRRKKNEKRKGENETCGRRCVATRETAPWCVFLTKSGLKIALHLRTHAK